MTEAQINAWARAHRPKWGKLRASNGTEPSGGKRVLLTLGPVTTYGHDRADAVALMADHIETVERG